MSAEDEFPAEGATGGTVEMSDEQYMKMCAEIDKWRSFYKRWTDTLPIIVAPNGCAMETSHGWVLVLPEEPKFGPFVDWAHPPVQQYCGPGCTVCNP